MPDVARLGIQVDSDGVMVADQRLGDLERTGGQAEQATSSLESSWSKFSRTMITVNQGLQLAGRVFSGLSRTVRGFTSAFEDNEAAAAKVDSVLRATGHAAGITATELDNMSKEMSAMTGIATSTIQESQAMMLTFREIGNEVFPRAQAAAADMAAVMGGDLPGATRRLSMALQDPTQGIARLSRSGVMFTQDQRDMIDAMVEAGDMMGAQTIILEEMENQFGGTAEAMRETARGSREAFSSALSDFKAEIGEGVEELLGPFRERMTTFMLEHGETIGLIFRNLPEFAEIAMNGIWQIMQETFTWERLTALFSRIGQTLIEQAQGAFQGMAQIWAAVGDGMRTFAETLGGDWFKALWNGLQRALDAPGRLLLNMMGLDVGPVPQTFDTDVTIGEALFEGIAVAARGAGEAYMDFVQGSMDRASELGTDIADMYSDITEGMATDFADLLARLRAEADVEDIVPPIAIDDIADDETVETVEELNEEVEKLMDSLRDQAAVAGMASTEIEMYRLSVAGATEAQLAEAAALQELSQSREQNARLMEVSLSLHERLSVAGGDVQTSFEAVRMEYHAGNMTLRQYVDALEDLDEKLDQTTRFNENFTNAMDRLNESMIQSGVQQFSDATFEIGEAMGSGAISAQSFTGAIGGMARQLMRMIPTMAIATGLKLLFEGDQRGWWMLGGGVAGLLGAGVMEGAIEGNATGGVYDRGGRVESFARGGAFTNSIVDKPTIFPMATGMGLMGEAGPEAVMPLTRTASGDLGVRAEGGSTYVTVINNATGAEARTEESLGDGGDKHVRVFIEGVVEGATARGRFDKVNSRRYGLDAKGAKV